MKNIWLLLCLFILSSCASEPGLDGKIIITDDGRVFELQHRIADAYVLYKLNIGAEVK